MKQLILTILLSFLLTTASAEDTLPTLEVTGIAIVHGKSKLPNSAIVNDKIWWEGTTYLIQDGKLLYPVTTSGRVRVDKNDLMKLVKVENGKITLEYRGKTLVRNIKKSNGD
jgi:hypothetical protein